MPLAIAPARHDWIYAMEVAHARDDGAGKQHALILRRRGANPLDAVSFDAAILIEPVENDPQLQALAQAAFPASTLAASPGTHTPESVVPAATAQLLLTHLGGSPRQPANVRYFAATHGEHQFWRERSGLPAGGARGAGAPVVYLSMKARGEKCRLPCRAQQLLLWRIPTLTACYADRCTRQRRGTGFPEQAVVIPERDARVTGYDGIRARANRCRR